MASESVKGIATAESQAGDCCSVKDSDDEDDEYLEMLESFSRRAQHNGEEFIPDGAWCFRVRRRLFKILHSFWCNIAIICLALLDAIILVCVLLLEIEALKLSPGHKQDTIQNARFGLECVSISIILIFMIEISLKFFALGPKHFCSHWIEVVDAIVTIISLVVDALVIADHVAHVSHHGEGNSGIIDAFGAAAGLLIVFRMWRIVRILNATLVTMSTGISRKIEKMDKKLITSQRRIYQLEHELTKHCIPLPDEIEQPDAEESHHHLHLKLHLGHHKRPEHETLQSETRDTH